MARAVTNDNLYEAIERTRLELTTQANQNRAELKGDVIRLETKFDTLEAGRLTRLEERVGKQQVGMATATTKLALVGFIAASIIGALVSAAAFKLLGAH